MKRKIFLLDVNNRRLKWWSTSHYRMALVPIVDAIVLIVGIPSLLFLLHIPIMGSDAVVYIMLVILYICACIPFALRDAEKFDSCNNTFIAKENNDITIVQKKTHLKGVGKSVIGEVIYVNSKSAVWNLVGLGIYTSGVIDMHESLSKKDLQELEKINKILNERSDEYQYTDYKNCQLLKESRTYYKYVGEKDGKPSKFKIYKVYANMDSLNKEEN